MDSHPVSTLTAPHSNLSFTPAQLVQLARATHEFCAFFKILIHDVQLTELLPEGMSQITTPLVRSMVQMDKVDRADLSLHTNRLRSNLMFKKLVPDHLLTMDDAVVSLSVVAQELKRAHYLLMQMSQLTPLFEKYMESLRWVIELESVRSLCTRFKADPDEMKIETPPDQCKVKMPFILTPLKLPATYDIVIVSETFQMALEECDTWCTIHDWYDMETGSVDSKGIQFDDESETDDVRKDCLFTSLVSGMTELELAVDREAMCIVTKTDIRSLMGADRTVSDPSRVVNSVKRRYARMMLVRVSGACIYESWKQLTCGGEGYSDTPSPILLLKQIVLSCA
jgi:hypothetical protein